MTVICTMAPASAKSSPPKKGVKSNKPSSPKQQFEPVHESDAYLPVKTYKGEVRKVPLLLVYTFPLLSSKIIF